MIFTSFIIPTIGRNTLERTLNSILAQTDGDWRAFVISDAVPGFRMPVTESRIFHIPLSEKVGCGPHFAGFVRNFGVGLALGEWVAFCDDDDTLDPRYVEWLKVEADGFDFVQFRMRYNPQREDGAEVIPRGLMAPGEMGISFAVRRSFQVVNDLYFTEEECEDFIYYQAFKNAGARIKISDRVAYFVRHSPESIP